MANTPQHNMRFPTELWEKIEQDAKSRETPHLTRYPRSWVVNEILHQHYSSLENNDSNDDSQSSANCSDATN